MTDTILSVLDVFIGLFSGNWEQCWNGIKGIFTGIWNFVVNQFSNILNTLRGVADVFLGWFGTSWNEVWTSIKDFFVGIWNSICSAFQAVADFFHKYLECNISVLYNDSDCDLYHSSHDFYFCI